MARNHRKPESRPPFFGEAEILVLEHLEACLARLEAAAPGGEQLDTLHERITLLEEQAEQDGHALPLLELVQRFGLRDLERDILLVACRPQLLPAARGQLRTLGELMERYFPEPEWRAGALAALGPHAPLSRHRLVSLWSSDPALHDQLLVQQLLAPPRVAAYLQRQVALGVGLSQLAQLVPPGAAEHTDPWVDTETYRGAAQLLEGWRERGSGQPLLLVLEGDRGSGKKALARRLAHRFGRTLLEIDGPFLQALDARTGIWAVHELYAAAELFEAWPLLHQAQAIQPCSPVGEALCSCLDRLPLPSLLLASSSLPEAGGLPARTTRRIQLRFPGETLRAGFWRAHLQLGEAPPLPEEDALALVAARYELGPGQVRNAARDWLWAAPSSSLQGLQAAAARQLASDPGSVVRIRRVQLGLDDLVLPREELEQVREILQACRNHFALLHRWGFRQRLAYGTGIVCLFSGEPGTGKTLCAQILASELGQDLFLVSLPDILSRWVGETEKQIARIFHEAKAAQAILLFDEADSLLGARTEVHSSSDRYANIATNFLLQEIEAYEGVVILTTNLEQNLDSAAARRILFRLRFPFPDVDGRRKLWQQLIPRQALQAKEIDFAALAEAFELSGGHIKNAIVRAAYEALERGRPIDTAGLAKAGVRECRAIGKLVRDEVPDRPVPRRKRRR